MPFFSVVIPLYNKENYVAESLRSVFSQTFADFEVIVVNDGSADSSASIARGFTDKRLQVVDHAANKGLNAARNTGIRKAAANHIAFLDADDVWKPNFLETIAALIAAYPEAGLFATNYAEEYPNGRLVTVRHHVALGEGRSGIVSDYYTAALAQPILWYGSSVVKKEVFEQAGPFDETITLWEDVDFNIRANMVAKMAFHNEICAIYRVFTENQIMNSPVTGKRIPDFDSYEGFAKTHPSAKRYLDVNRYILAIRFKLAGDRQTYKRLARGIDRKNLTARQKLLLSLPVFAVRFLKKVKLLLVGKGVRLTTFGPANP